MTSLRPVRVWDLPTRCFHWVLAATVVGSVVSAKIGGNAMVWHFRFGYLVFGLLLFRLVWGLVGGHWSRFARWSLRPRSVWAYLRGGAHADAGGAVGHSPLGAWSVLALLGFLALQVATGLVADDEIASVGPLNRFVSGAFAERATDWHQDVGQWVLIGLVTLHLAAVLTYLLAWRRNLITPMFTGDKLLPADTPASADGAARRLAAGALALACAGVVAWVVGLGDGLGDGA